MPPQERIDLPDHDADPARRYLRIPAYEWSICDIEDLQPLVEPYGYHRRTLAPKRTVVAVTINIAKLLHTTKIEGSLNEKCKEYPAAADVDEVRPASAADTTGKEVAPVLARLTLAKAGIVDNIRIDKIVRTACCGSTTASTVEEVRINIAAAQTKIATTKIAKITITAIHAGAQAVTDAKAMTLKGRKQP